MFYLSHYMLFQAETLTIGVSRRRQRRRRQRSFFINEISSSQAQVISVVQIDEEFQKELLKDTTARISKLVACIKSDAQALARWPAKPFGMTKQNIWQIKSRSYSHRADYTYKLARAGGAVTYQIWHLRRTPKFQVFWAWRNQVDLLDFSRTFDIWSNGAQY